MKINLKFSNNCKIMFSSRKYFSFKFITKEQVNFYNENGYLLLKNFFSEKKIDELKNEMTRLLDTQNPEELTDIFKAGKNFNTDYFLKSADKIHFFLEEEARDAEGKIKYPLKECVNKVGHGLEYNLN